MDIVKHLVGSSSVLRYKWMPQQSRSGPPPRRLSLQTTSYEIPKLPRRCGRSLRWLRHADCTHQARPIALATHRERESSEIELKDAYAEAPNVPGVTIVLSLIEICVNPFWTHVSNSPNRRIARIHGLFQDPTHTEIGDLHLFPSVDE